MSEPSPPVLSAATGESSGDPGAAVQAIENSDTTKSIPDYTNRKVIIHNVPKFCKNSEINKLVSAWVEGTAIEVIKSKKPPKKTWLVLTLAEEEMVDQLLNILNDGKHTNKKGGVLRAIRASERNDNKRSIDEGDNGGEGRKRMRRDDYVKTPDEIRDALTPLWRLPYEEQVQLKTKNMVIKCLSKITKEIKAKVRTLQKDKVRQKSQRKSDGGLYEWLNNQQPIYLKPILKAPKYFQYRNKSELTFGYRHTYSNDDKGKEIKESKDNIAVDGEKPDKEELIAEEQINKKEVANENMKKIIKTPAVGFLAGGWSGGVSSPHFASNIPDIVCGISDILDEFLKDSPIPPYTSSDHRGVWRTITIRSSDITKQCMIIICHAPAKGGAGAKIDGSDDYSDVFDKEKERLVKMLTGRIPKPKRELSGPGTENMNNDEGFFDYKVTSLFFQEFEGLSNPTPQHPVQHVYGEKFLEEKLLQCTFQISPGAFFQVTTEGAEVLYKVVVDRLKEVTTNPEDTLLFDVCCGTGTIGLTCMKEGAVGKVVGIDISEPAIKDAIVNAEKNGFSGTNGCTKFVASRAENAMYNEIKSAGRGKSMVAVVDPSREGLHQDVCKALRNERAINRIIYVSCNPTGSLIKDAGILCSPETKKYRGLPFKISSAQPVDMFPLTDHCEMVMVFDRMSRDEADGKDGSTKGENISSSREGAKEEKSEPSPKNTNEQTIDVCEETKNTDACEMDTTREESEHDKS